MPGVALSKTTMSDTSKLRSQELVVGVSGIRLHAVAKSAIPTAMSRMRCRGQRCPLFVRVLSCARLSETTSCLVGGRLLASQELGCWEIGDLVVVKSGMGCWQIEN